MKFTSNLTPDSQMKIVAPPKPVMLDKMVSTDEVEYTGSVSPSLIIIAMDTSTVDMNTSSVMSCLT